MASELKTVRLEPAYAGFNTDSSPNVLPKGRGQVLINYLAGEPGRIRQRGPISSTAISIGVANKLPCGILGGSREKVLLGLKAMDSATQTREPQVAPYRVGAAGNLAKAYPTTVRYASLISGATGTFAPTSRQHVPHWPSAAFGKFIYSIAYDSLGDTGDLADNTWDNGRGGFERDTPLLRWDSSTSATAGLVAYDYAPYCAQDVLVHFGRLLVAGGRDGPVAAPSPVIYHNRIRYTRALDPNDFLSGFSPSQAWPAGVPTDGAYTAWTDEISAAYNLIDMPGDNNDFIVRMVHCGRNIAVLKRNEICLLTGFGPSTWAARVVETNIGCIDPRSVVEARGGCFFMSRHGFAFFDGQEAKVVSQEINRTLLTAALNAVGDQGVDGGYVIATNLDRDNIEVTVGAGLFAASPAGVAPTFWGVFNIPSGAWTVFLSASMAQSSMPMWVGRTSNKQFVVDKDNLFTVPYLTNPENASEGTRGKDGTNNIATTWTSKVAELSMPGNKATLARIMIDYEWIVDGAADEAFPGALTGANSTPVVTVRDGRGTFAEQFPLPSGPADPAPEGFLRKRYTFDLFNITDTVQVQIAYAQTARALVQCTIHDVWVEYQTAGPRRGSSAA